MQKTVSVEVRLTDMSPLDCSAEHYGVQKEPRVTYARDELNTVCFSPLCKVEFLHSTWRSLGIRHGCWYARIGMASGGVEGAAVSTGWTNPHHF